MTTRAGHPCFWVHPSLVLPNGNSPAVAEATLEHHFLGQDPTSLVCLIPECGGIPETISATPQLTTVNNARELQN